MVLATLLHHVRMGGSGGGNIVAESRRWRRALADHGREYSSDSNGTAAAWHRLAESRRWRRVPADRGGEEYSPDIANGTTATAPYRAGTNGVNGTATHHQRINGVNGTATHRRINGINGTAPYRQRSINGSNGTAPHRRRSINDVNDDQEQLAAGTDSCPPASALFSFGDSLADTGNVEYVFPYTTPAERLPYGEQNPFRKPSFRYSDGRLVIDFIGIMPCLPYQWYYLLDPALRS
jgi:hypothetical protein